MRKLVRGVLIFFGVIVASIAILLLILFPPFNNTSLTYRYRLTLEVDTPEGPKSGSSVIEQWLKLRGPLWWAPGLSIGRYRGGVRGEAAFVDLGSGHHIFAILARGATAREDAAQFLALGPGALGVGWGNDKEPSTLRDAVVRRAKVDVPLKLLPTLITFGDLSDPNTAEVVPIDGFARAFGPGYAFRKATVEYFSAGWWPANEYGLSGIPLTNEMEFRIPDLLKLVCERDKKRGLEYPGPYEARMSHFIHGKPYKQTCVRKREW